MSVDSRSLKLLQRAEVGEDSKAALDRTRGSGTGCSENTLKHHGSSHPTGNTGKKKKVLLKVEATVSRVKDEGK